MGSAAIGADLKRQAIDCWTAVSFGTRVARGDHGTRSYFESLLQGRHDYAPWMRSALDYEGARGLEVLGVGCGQGIDLANYALSGARPTGVDLTPRHVELARVHLAAMGLSGAVLRADAEALPFEDASFDRVSSNGVLHHTPDMPATLREIRRVLRPCGEARVIVYNRNSLHYWINQVLGHAVLQGRFLKERSMSGVMSYGEGGSRPGARPLVRVYTRRSLAAAFEEAGLRTEETRVYQFRLEDLFLTKPFQRFAGPRVQPFLERVGHKAGWYVVGLGVRCA